MKESDHEPNLIGSISWDCGLGLVTFALFSIAVVALILIFWS